MFVSKTEEGDIRIEGTTYYIAFDGCALGVEEHPECHARPLETLALLEVVMWFESDAAQGDEWARKAADYIAEIYMGGPGFPVRF